MQYNATSLTDLLADHLAEPVASSIPSIGTESDLAQLFGIGASRIRTLARDGTVVRVGRNRFDVAASTRRYVERLRELAEKQPSAVPAEPDPLKVEKLRLVAAQREAQEMKNAATRGELISAESVLRGWEGILRDVRNGILAVPSRCGAVLPHLTAADVARIDIELRKALEGLANGS